MLGYPGFLVLLALSVFNHYKVEVSILETGMGGETDSTNVIPHAIVTGISELGFDHENRLGYTIESIAWHKAGIFKDRVPAFSVPQVDAAAEVLRARALERNTSVSVVSDQILRDNGVVVCPDMPFQRANAALAIALASTVANTLHPGNSLSVCDMKTLEQTILPAKFERVSRGRLEWILSSAHNVMSVKSAAQAFRALLERSDQPAILLFSHESQRDSDELLPCIAEEIGPHQAFHSTVFCSDASGGGSSRNLDSQDLRRLPDSSQDVLAKHRETWTVLQSEGCEIHVLSQISDATDHIERLGIEATVLVIGSAYLAGTARAMLVPSA